MNLECDGSNRITPYTDLNEHDSSSGMILRAVQDVQWSINELH